MSGEFFSGFFRNYLNITFGKAGPKANGKRLFVMDNDPSQTSNKAFLALNEIEAELHRLPARSPDLNPIENVFHVLKRRLEHEAQEMTITTESFQHFKERVLRCCEDIDVATIDRTIASLPKRINSVIKTKGTRTKY